MLPELAVTRHVLAGNVVRHRYSRELDDAALDRVKEGEVAHCPRKEGAFDVTGTAQEEWCRGKVEHGAYSELALDCLKSRDPEPRCLGVLLGFVPLVPSGNVLVRRSRFLAVTVVGFVVQDEDVLHAHQFPAGPLKHLPFGFRRGDVLAVALQQRTGTLCQLRALPAKEGVVVGDDDFCAAEIRQHVVRN